MTSQMPKAKIYSFIKSNSDEFVIPVQDNKGHTARGTFRCPPAWMAEVSNIVATRMFPYQDVSHVLRHALWRHLQWLKGKDDRLKRHLSWMEAFMRIVQKSEKRREYGTMVAHLDREIDALKRAGALEDAKNLAFQAVNLIVNSGPDDTWKRKALMHIRTKHADLLAMGVSLNPEEFISDTT